MLELFGISLLGLGVLMIWLRYISLRKINEPDGILHIDTSNPEFDNYYFELTIPLEDLPKRDIITLKIQNHNSREN